MSALAELLTEHRRGHVVGHAVHCVCDPETGYSIDRFFAHQAEMLTSAGYRKPRTITTREEVEALGEGAVLVDTCGDLAQRRDGLWCSYETSPMSDHRMAKYLPATLLREGTRA